MLSYRCGHDDDPTWTGWASTFALNPFPTLSFWAMHVQAGQNHTSSSSKPAHFETSLITALLLIFSDHLSNFVSKDQCSMICGSLQ